MGLKVFTIDFVEISRINTLLLTTRVKKYSKSFFSNCLPLSYFLDSKNKFSLGQIKREDYQTNGDFPIIDQSQEFIAGYSDEEDLVYSGNLPVIVFGDHTRIFKYVDFKFIQGADGIKILKPNEEIVNPKFFYYLLSKIGVPSRGYNRHFSILQKQKYPLIPKSEQDKIVSKIEPIENKIKELKAQIIEPQEIINKVFAREFGFNIDKFEENKNKKFFDVEFSNVLKNNLLRISTHFHHIKLSSLEDKLRDKDFWKPLNTKFKLSGGKRIPKGKTFSNDITDYYYLRPTEVSIWGIEKSDATYISEDLYNQLKRYKIKTGEFCISIVGTLGKTALINTKDLDIEDDNLILSENFIKLTPIQKINNMFFYYYFYSFIFEAQMDREYTITSIKKLGIDKWNYIKIPNIPLEAQQKIVDEIKAELDKQELLKQQITTERNKIDKIIEECIMTAQ